MAPETSRPRHESLAIRRKTATDRAKEKKQVLFVHGAGEGSWQITPRALTEALAAGGAEAERAFEAMLSMKKIGVATIEAVRRG